MNIKDFQIPVPNVPCECCGIKISEPEFHFAYRIPTVAGVHCSVLCIEATLFGGIGRCRWCGTEMLDEDGETKPYTSINSRLCSDDCKTNYLAQVVPENPHDKSAAAGTGKRLLLWLQNRTAIQTEKRHKRIIQRGVTRKKARLASTHTDT